MNPNQIKPISIEKLRQLRDLVVRAYAISNQEELHTPNNKNSPYYHYLREAIFDASDNYISEGTLNKFFNDNLNTNYEIGTIESIEKYIHSFLGNDPQIKNDSPVHHAPHPSSEQIENKLLNYYKERITLAVEFSDDLDLSLESLNDDDIRMLQKIQPLRESLGEIHWELISERMEVNKDIVKGLKMMTPIDKIIIGFFILYPITKKCHQSIEKGEIIKSDEFKTENIAKDFESAEAIYISLVFAVDRYSKAFLLLKLKDELLSILSHYPNLKTLYVRPATEDGLRNIQRNNFTKLNRVSDLYTIKTDHIFQRIFPVV